MRIVLVPALITLAVTLLRLTGELMGWSETHVTQRFWLVSILAAMLGVALALV